MGLITFPIASKLRGGIRGFWSLYANPWRQCRTRPWRFLGRLAFGGFILCFLLGFVFSGVVFIQAQINKEDFANQAAVTLRKIIGLDNVSRIEYQVFSLGKKWRRLFPHVHGKVNPRLEPWLAMPARSPRPAAYGDRPIDMEPLMVDPPMPGQKEGVWRRPLARKNWYWETDIRPNLEFPDRVIHLFAFDMRRLKLVFIPGREVTGSDELSSIPTADRPFVRFVFNGGFRRDFVSEIGQRKNGVTYHELGDGRGTLIMHEQGVRIQPWGSQVARQYPKADLRQNLFPLLQDGLANQQFEKFMVQHHLDFPTRRDAIGITADGHWLVFAAGSITEPCDLALSLQYAGCVNAMLLDQNGGNVFFESVEQSDEQLLFRPYSPSYHLKNIERVLEGSKRDFLYLMELPDQTAAPSGKAGAAPPPAAAGKAPLANDVKTTSRN